MTASISSCSLPASYAYDEERLDHDDEKALDNAKPDVLPGVVAVRRAAAASDEWHGPSPGDAVQIVTPTIGVAWFDPGELRARTIARHGAAGTRCDGRGVWRWYPLLSEDMPPYRYAVMGDDVHVAASTEWFGDGHQAFRQIIARRALRR